MQAILKIYNSKVYLNTTFSFRDKWPIFTNTIINTNTIISKKKVWKFFIKEKKNKKDKLDITFCWNLKHCHYISFTLLHYIPITLLHYIVTHIGIKTNIPCIIIKLITNQTVLSNKENFKSLWSILSKVMNMGSHTNTHVCMQTNCITYFIG